MSICTAVLAALVVLIGAWLLYDERKSLNSMQQNRRLEDLYAAADAAEADAAYSISAYDDLDWTEDVSEQEAVEAPIRVADPDEESVLDSVFAGDRKKMQRVAIYGWDYA